MTEQEEELAMEFLFAYYKIIEHPTAWEAPLNHFALNLLEQLGFVECKTKYSGGKRLVTSSLTPLGHAYGVLCGKHD